VEQFWRLPALPGAHSCIAALPRRAARVCVCSEASLVGSFLFL
jgi:hypothetical protein